MQANTSPAPASAWWLALIAPLLWGTTYPVTKAWLVGFDPMWLATLRILVPGLLMLPLVPLSVWRSRWLAIAVLSTLNIGLFTALLFAGLQRLPGGMAATLTASMPLQILLIRALLGRFPSLLQLLCATGGIAGVALLVWQSPVTPDWTGVACSLLAATSMSIGVLLIPVLGKDIKPMIMTSAQLALAGVVLLLVTMLAGRPFPQLTLGSVLALGWLGPVTMGMGYILWFRSVARLPVDKLAFLGLVNPVVAVVAGVLFLSEALSLVQLAAIVLVLVCVVMAQLPARTQAKG
ncbi:DMT family transporter [Thalassolituus marinus]|uniref:EamA family transporter n=1 Tax=Thalassolituus marinus TaxID=671053 RepID=A0ABS7ZP92_9GAMM|nr:EamA family transporter [Thalassolituus marinus]MCA6062180.1 EamA family transporter [Thalassolituus marinus]